VESLLFSNVRFISPLQIKQQYWAKSEKLVSKIDANDIPYIAYAYQFRCRLWSGDLVLKKGLERLGNNKVISTNEVAAFLEQTKGAKRK
jgi:predicted nucleic acid-binding protein